MTWRPTASRVCWGMTRATAWAGCSSNRQAARPMASTAATAASAGRAARQRWRPAESAGTLPSSWAANAGFGTNSV